MSGPIITFVIMPANGIHGYLCINFVGHYKSLSFGVQLLFTLKLALYMPGKEIFTGVEENTEVTLTIYTQPTLHGYVWVCFYCMLLTIITSHLQAINGINRKQNWLQLKQRLVNAYFVSELVMVKSRGNWTNLTLCNHVSTWMFGKLDRK